MGLAASTATVFAASAVSSAVWARNVGIHRVMFAPQAPLYKPKAEDGYMTVDQTLYWCSVPRTARVILLYMHGNAESVQHARTTLLKLQRDLQTQCNKALVATPVRAREESKVARRDLPERDPIRPATHSSDPKATPPLTAKQVRADARIDVAAVEYTGYAPHDYGKVDPSPEGACASALSVARALLERHPDCRLLIVGYSIGSGVAAQMASELSQTHASRIAGLALIAPFESMSALANQYTSAASVIVPSGMFDTKARLLELVRAKPDIPLLLVHGTLDAVIPVDHSERLAALLSSAKPTLRLLPNSDHCRIDWQTEVAQWAYGLVRAKCEGARMLPGKIKATTTKAIRPRRPRLLRDGHIVDGRPDCSSRLV